MNEGTTTFDSRALFLLLARWRQEMASHEVEWRQRAKERDEEGRKSEADIVLTIKQCIDELEAVVEKL